MRAHRVQRAAAVAAMGSLIVGLGLVAQPVAAAGADPTAEEVALAALLQPGDVPGASADLAASIETDPTAIDLPGFEENGGLREVRQTWFAPDPVLIVYDFRWQFPDATSAEAFLDASEELLGEVSSGAVKADPPQTPLPDTRFYAFEDTVLGTGTVGLNWLMRHENLVAKVYVSGQKEDVSEAQAAAIAQTAAARMVQALEGGAVESPGPAGTPAPTAASSSDLDALLAHVPDAVHGTCAAVEYASGAPPATGELVQVRCPTSNGAVSFILYDTVEDMDAAYDVAHRYAEVFGSFAATSDCETGSFDGTWTVGGEDAGRLLCDDLQGAASIVWSHPATRILSVITNGGGDHEAAFQLWLVAGPE